MIMFAEAYFDESGTDAGSPVVCVAGYLFEKDQCLRMDAEWKAALEAAGISHFHMVECAQGVGKFARKSKAERIEIESRLIGIIKRRACVGIVCSVCPEDYLHFVPGAKDFGGAYQLLLSWCIVAVSTWVAKHDYQGEIAYFFEAGHALEAHANASMIKLRNTPALKHGCRYRSHLFIGKNDARPIQAADLLAWQWHREWINEHGPVRRGRRADFNSLLDLPHMHCHLTRENIQALLQEYGRPENIRRFGILR
jgi:hypothetical protein